MHLSSVFWLGESHFKMVACVAYSLPLSMSNFSFPAAGCPVPVLVAFQ